MKEKTKIVIGGLYLHNKTGKTYEVDSISTDIMTGEKLVNYYVYIRNRTTRSIIHKYSRPLEIFEEPGRFKYIEVNANSSKPPVGVEFINALSNGRKYMIWMRTTHTETGDTLIHFFDTMKGVENGRPKELMCEVYTTKRGS